MKPTVLGHTGALVYTRRGAHASRRHKARRKRRVSGAAMKGETSGGKRGASASRATPEGDISATRRAPARTLGQMTTVSQRQTQLIPQPQRALAPVETSSRRSLLPIKPQHLGHVWRARAV